MNSNSSLLPGITQSTTSNLRRNLFYANVGHTSHPSTSSTQQSQPPAAPRRPTSRPTSRTATRSIQPPTSATTEQTRPYSRGYARPQSRAVRPRSRGFGFDGADERDVGMYDDGEAADIGQEQHHEGEEEEQQLEDITDERILIDDDEAEEVEGLPTMEAGEVDQMLAMVMQGLDEAEEEDDEERNDGGGERHVDGNGKRVKITTEMIEMYRTGKGRLVDETEFQQAVRASLRQKVASLDDDKWMYEEEEAGNDSS